MFTRFKRLTCKASLLATALSLVAFTAVLAASGDLDTTFSGDGKAIDFVVPSNPARWDAARGIAIQPADGKIVVAGDSIIPSTKTRDFAVLRYNTNGTLDTTFSGDGRLITNFGGQEQAYDVALQANGKIVVVGQICSNTAPTCDVALARYNPNGALDSTFSGDGKVASDFGGEDNGSFGGIAIHGVKIVVAGYVWNGADYDFAVYRYLSNGRLDPTFSGDGKVRINFGVGRQDGANDLVIQSDGKIVVVGSTADANSSNSNFALARLNPNGSLDATFSGDGRQIANFGGEDFGGSVALQPNGKIVVAGSKNTAALGFFALARFNANGNLDATFAGTGKKLLSVMPNRDSGASDVLIQPGGKIVVTGSTDNGTNDDFALVRLNGNGSLDTTFSGNGRAFFDFGGEDNGIALALQPSDGKYVIGGLTHDGTQRDMALARILP
jgi:uncharacterized delta-60 repeat protein